MPQQTITNGILNIIKIRGIKSIKHTSLYHCMKHVMNDAFTQYTVYSTRMCVHFLYKLLHISKNLRLFELDGFRLVVNIKSPKRWLDINHDMLFYGLPHHSSSSSYIYVIHYSIFTLIHLPETKMGYLNSGLNYTESECSPITWNDSDKN